MPESDLDRAYSLETPDDNRSLYRDWASDYDRGFAEERGYVFPQNIAKHYRAEARESDVPILDVGAGTGLVGEALRAEGVKAEMDALDISPEMLAEAGRKAVYRDHVVGDLTGTLNLPDGHYGALVASGVFTHGHVGPVCLPELLRITKPGALCVFGINPGVFDTAGFGSAFAMLVAEKRISPVHFEKFRIYDRDGHDHAEDIGFLAGFRKSEG